MILKRTCLLQVVFVLVFVNSAYSQVFKSYNGIFQGGIAKYQYYEDNNFERIYHGPFYYDMGGGEYIKGQYNQNLKSGTWVEVEMSDGSIGKVKKIKTFNYLNGRLDGIFDYTIIDRVSNKVVLNVKTQFKNNIQIGEFSFFNKTSTFDSEYDVAIKGRFDENGFINGKYYKKYYKDRAYFELNRNYKHGILYNEICKNTSTGEIVSRKTDSLFIHFIEKYNIKIDSSIAISCTNLSQLSSEIKQFEVDYELEDQELDKMYHEKCENDQNLNFILPIKMRRDDIDVGIEKYFGSYFKKGEVEKVEKDDFLINKGRLLLFYDSANND